jgi:hypothetical protein
MSDTTTSDTQGGGAAGDDTAAGAGDDAFRDDPGSLFGAADKDAAAAIEKDADGKGVRPEWIPEQFWDAERGEARTADMAKSWADLRRMVSRGDHKPPEKPEAYQVPKVEGLPVDLIGHKDDAVWAAVTKAAHQAGVTQKQLDAIAQPLLARVAETMQAEDPAAAEAAAKEAARAELAKLGPNGAQVVRDTGAWLNGLAGRGILTKAELQDLRGISTAAGIRALAKLRELSGDKPIPTEAFDPGEMTPADAQKMMQQGMAKGDQAMVERARKRLAQLEAQGMRW